MATGTPQRDFINPRRQYGGGEESAQKKVSNANIMARHANASIAQATTGMSAPYSARDQSPSAIDDRSGSGGETADERWARLFPNAPMAYGGSAPPAMSNHDAAMATSAPTRMVTQNADPTSTRDKNGVPTSVPSINAYLDYYHGGMTGPSQTTPPPTMTPSAPVQSTPAYVDPSLPAPVVNDAGIQRMNPTEQTAARTQLLQNHPEVFTEGSPQNQAFVAHAKQYGEQSAHDNADKILEPLNRLDSLTRQVSGQTAAPKVAAKNQIDPYQFAQD